MKTAERLKCWWAGKTLIGIKLKWQHRHVAILFIHRPLESSFCIPPEREILFIRIDYDKTDFMPAAN